MYLILIRNRSVEKPVFIAQVMEGDIEIFRADDNLIAFHYGRSSFFIDREKFVMECDPHFNQPFEGEKTHGKTSKKT